MHFGLKKLDLIYFNVSRARACAGLKLKSITWVDFKLELGLICGNDIWVSCDFPFFDIFGLRNQRFGHEFTDSLRC